MREMFRIDKDRYGRTVLRINVFVFIAAALAMSFIVVSLIKMMWGY